MHTPSLQQESPNPDRHVPALELPAWRERFGLVAGITTRGGRTAEPYDLGLWSSDAPAAAVMRRWGEFRQGFAPGFPAVAFSRQCHGNRVRWHAGTGEGWLLLDGYDGHLTAAGGLLLTVSVADCVPVYLAGPGGQVCGIVHAGWRGTAAGVLEAALQQFSTHASVSMSAITIHCGVSICGNCYEVGPEVVLNVTGRWVGGPTGLDLRAELARRARACGVADVSVSAYCTSHDSGLFHSHRASGGRAGRMVAYLGRPREGVAGT